MVVSKELENSFLNWRLALAAQTACILEVDAPKVGNVNRFYDFEDSSLEDFHCSALAIGRAFGYLEKLGVGRTIYEALKATREFVPTNTNLGIMLLLAPLGMAWCRINRVELGRIDTGLLRIDTEVWRKEIRKVLDNLSVEDTVYVYKAIKIASPSGMGQVKKYDVYLDESPRITLLEAMALAADRDMIAKQYTNQFELVLKVGYEALERFLAEGLSLPQAIAQTHLFLLSQYQDTLIVRKLGPDVGREVQRRARTVWERGGWLTPDGKEQILVFDRWLREDGHQLNPGSTADLIAAIIFVFLLGKQWKMEGVGD